MCEGAGERFSEIELSLVASAIITDDRAAATDRYIHQQGWSGVEREDVWDMPSVLIGTVDQIGEQIIATRDQLGVSYFIVSDRVKDEFAPVVARLGGQ